MLSFTIIARAEALRAELPDAFAHKVLDGSLLVAWDKANPIRLNLFAAGIRELVSYCLHLTSPDEEILKCEWYSPPENAGTGISRIQRMTYATQGGLPDLTLAQLGVEPKETHRELVRVFNELNKHTHVRPGSIVEQSKEVESFVENALEAVLDFYEVLSEVRNVIATAVLQSVNDKAFHELTRTAIQELDELSGQTIVNGVEVEEITVLSITAGSIALQAQGKVYVELNYGTVDDGTTLSDEYPFTMSANASTLDLQKIEAGRLVVDNSSFFE